ncbi:MAG: hypothetical protein KAX16_03790, partial [Actinomycetia bacterium]|nr:hypothetical protein [Actinomycetes bacterium]
EAPATPDGSRTWGETTYKIWERAAKGKPLLMAEAAATIPSASPVSVFQIPIFAVVIVFVLVLIINGMQDRKD